MRPSSCLDSGDIRPPQVFISSTFEDWVREVRDQVRQVLEQANYQPMMSELGSFSYTHSQRVYDDTINAVSACQIYVLVIGRAYGTIHPQRGKSITELEYEAALTAGIPIFVYVKSSVWDGFKAHRAGALTGDSYTHWVDDLRTFEFLERVAMTDGYPCERFENAHEVLSHFRDQLANLLGGYLRFQTKAARWLWTERFTRDLERTADLVWVLTPDFFWDYTDRDFREIVFHNVTKRDAKYFYAFKNNPVNEQRAVELGRHYAAEIGDVWKERVRFAAIPEEQFGWSTEQALFNAGDARRERGIVVDPMDGRNIIDKFNIELGREKLVNFREQFGRVWAAHGSGKLQTLSAQS
jgi:hypothetical protein